MQNFEVYRRVFPSIPPIVLRNFFVLVNGIIFLVIVLLFAFGSFQAGLFLGIVFFLNTVIAISQDIHARVLLERLQMLTALRVIRINPNKTETLVLAENIEKGDLIKLKLGDQVPCEGVLVSANNLEISEALITGESDAFSKKARDKIVAGAIVVSGVAVMESEGLFRESRLFKIAGEMRNYQASPSSIQRAVTVIVKYSGYILILVIFYVAIRGFILHLPRLDIVTEIGALASAIAPQGLIVTITVLFAIGAASYSRRNVLFQEINATEKLGQIKNLCIDKTGTLTDNKLIVEKMHVIQGFREDHARALAYECILGLNDSTETLLAIKKYLEDEGEKIDGDKIEILNTLTFSSWRRYGVVEMKEGNIIQSVFFGAPDILIQKVSNPVEKKWLENIVEQNSHMGKRVLCVAGASEVGLPKNLESVHLEVIAIFVFHNTLREGIHKAIKFFNDRKIKIRVLSGDNLNTVRVVAESVGISSTENFITGKEIETWNSHDFDTLAHKYSVFAEVLPEHKVKLVEAFKKDGFTAMVGDGVNDALAMKKSDLGIAMFDGVPVTRQLADVILMTNSFSDLPGAVELADHFIRSIEITSGIYINQSIIALFLFIFLAFFGYSFPLVPLNITIINYFTVGFAGILIAYWAIRPFNKINKTADKPFLSRIMPLVFVCGVLEAIGIAIVFFLSPDYLKTSMSNTLVIFSIMIFGYFFLLFATKVYCGVLSKKEKFQLFLLGVFQIILLLLALQIPFIIRFFYITLPYPPFMFFLESIGVVLIFILVQYILVQKFFLKNRIFSVLQ